MKASKLLARSFVLSLCVALAVSQIKVSQAAGRLNVLLISIDTLRADHLGCYGSRTKTPAIDRLASNGVVFENTISQVPLTLPSHSTIFTGLFPDQHGVRNNENFILDKRFETLAERFARHGYKTGAVVGSFSLDSTFGVDQGFQYYEDNIGKGITADQNRNAERRAQSVWNEGKKWLEQQKDRWFLFLHFFDPHTGYNPPRPFPQTYDGEIAYVDQVFGEILNFLESFGRLRTTAIVLLSDHGESLGEHGEASHGVFLYDATLKVPLILSAPSLGSARFSQQVRLADVAPTITALAGITPLTGSGSNLLADSGTRRADLPAYSETYYTNLLMSWAPLKAIRINNQKWIQAPKQEFYNLSADPGERHNIYRPNSVPALFRQELNKRSAASQAASNQPVDAETREKLASLGYLSGGSGTTTESGLDPKDGIAIWSEIERAVSFAQLGQTDQAKQRLASVLAKQPDNVIARKFLAAILRKQGNDSDALRHLQAALKSPLHRRETRVDIAEIYYNRKQYQASLSEAETILKDDGQYYRALKLAAYSSAKTKQYEKSETYFRRLLSIHSRDPQVLSEYATTLAQMGRDREALSLYQKLQKTRALTEAEAIQVAAIHLTMRNPQEAEKMFQHAIQLNDNSVSAWKGLALIAAAGRRWPDAFRAFIKAGECAEAEKLSNQFSASLAPGDVQMFRQKCKK